jgi:putative radical SAM enzyme (TIGR03279 family)
MDIKTMSENGDRSGVSNGLLIQTVVEGSPGWDAGLRKGDRLLALNGFPLRDLIDLEFYQAESEILIEYRSGGEVVQVLLEKDPDGSLGIAVDPPPIKRCPNDCEFCFVDQMPAGARKSLYIRDEDYRYSFLYGNFITLTNLSEKDYLRILDQKLSPLYISVHATPLGLRRKILKNQKAPDILPLLKRLIDGGITLHTQIVLTPEVNDGEVLYRSWEDLLSLYPGVESLAIVPVGLTSHRESLPDLPLINQSIAREMLKNISRLQKASFERVNDTFVYPADEWYVIADKQFPSLSRYGSLPQLGNGVGLVPLFQRQWKKSFRSLKGNIERPLVLVTGMAFAPHLEKLVELRESSLSSPGREMTVLKVPNDYFGRSVTVAGLMAARDIISAIRKASFPRHAILCVPDICLKDDTDILIDDGTLDEIARETGHQTVSVPSSATEFLRWVKTERVPVSEKMETVM